MARLRAWQRRLYGAGYVGMDWPTEYGGRGASIVEQIIFYEEMSRAEAPQPLNRSGLSMLGPTIMRHGTPAQRERHLAKILTAEEIWCQGFSEPNAGSDLANLQTRAVLDGDTTSSTARRSGPHGACGGMGLSSANGATGPSQGHHGHPGGQEDAGHLHPGRRQITGGGSRGLPRDVRVPRVERG